jgi:hypothetical protein
MRTSTRIGRGGWLLRNVVIGTLTLSAVLAACDPGVMAGVSCPDGDDDGVADCTVTGCDPTGLVCGDCDDANASVLPGAPEVCNHIDDDCDGLIDPEFSSPTSMIRVLDPRGFIDDPANPLGQAATAVSSLLVDFVHDAAGGAIDAGDANGDGVPDFAIGWRQSPSGPNLGDGVGRVVLFSGVFPFDVICTATGDVNNQWLGGSLAAIGEVTGDGVPDLAVGKEFSWGGTGGVVVISGKRTGTTDCEVAFDIPNPDEGPADRFGYALAAMPDLFPQDGIPEILVGAPGSGWGAPGKAFVLAGDNGYTLLNLVSPDPLPTENLGASISAIGDLNGDGVPDILVGAPDPRAPGVVPGRVEAFSGLTGAHIRSFQPPGGNAHVGADIAPLGDITGDDVPEFATLGPTGGVYVFNGSDATVEMSTGITGGSTLSIAAFPDVTGDGVREILVGDRYANVAALHDGQVVLLSGANGDVLRNLWNPNGESNEWLGYQVGLAGDLTGGGLPEILALVPEAKDTNLDRVGGVAIFSIESDCDLDGENLLIDPDDTDPSCWAAPGEVGTVTFTNRDTLAWLPPDLPGAPMASIFYDVIRSEDPSDFTTEAICVETDDGLDTAATDFDLPDLGTAFYYLVRAENPCASGAMGNGPGDNMRDVAGCS